MLLHLDCFFCFLFYCLCWLFPHFLCAADASSPATTAAKQLNDHQMSLFSHPACLLVRRGRDGEKKKAIIRVIDYGDKRKPHWDAVNTQRRKISRGGGAAERRPHLAGRHRRQKSHFRSWQPCRLWRVVSIKCPLWASLSSSSPYMCIGF